MKFDVFPLRSLWLVPWGSFIPPLGCWLSFMFRLFNTHANFLFLFFCSHTHGLTYTRNVKNNSVFTQQLVHSKNKIKTLFLLLWHNLKRKILQNETEECAENSNRATYSCDLLTGIFQPCRGLLHYKSDLYTQPLWSQTLPFLQHTAHLRPLNRQGETLRSLYVKQKKVGHKSIKVKNMNVVLEVAMINERRWGIVYCNGYYKLYI